MTLDEFRDDFLEAANSADVAGGANTFTELAGDRLIEAEEFAEFQPCAYEGNGLRKRRLKVDGYFYDELDNSLSLIITDFSGEKTVTTFGSTEVNRSFGMLRGFLEEALSESSTLDFSVDHQQAKGLTAQIKIWKNNVSRYRLYLVSDRQLNSRTKDWPQDRLEETPIEFHIWDIERFYLAHQSASGRDELFVDFKEFGEGIPCLKAGDENREYDGYLCIVPGDVLAGIFDRYGSRLLEGNVRSFLSTKGKVNSGIQITIRNNPEMFFAYNNGITATAEDVTFESRKTGLFLTDAVNLQIVNGAQTTASLAAARRKDGTDLSNVFVQMKLAVLSPEKAGKLVPDIAKFANSQNKISDADFFSNHAYHIRLEEFSRRIWAPATGGAQRGTHWFYERARGQYLNEQAKLSKAQRTQFQLQNPKHQLLTKTDIAKLENTRRSLPHKVSLGAQKNFVIFAEWIAKQWEIDETKFHEEYFKELVAYAILFKHVESLVSMQSWYQGGYRANIVTYTLAKLQALIENHAPKQRLDLRHIWDRQAIPAPLTQQLIVIAKQVFEILTDDSRPKENVTEWAKMEACWERVKLADIALDRSCLDMLADVAAAKRLQKAASEQQRTDNGIAVQTAVVSIAGKKWADIRTWGEKQGLLDAKELEVLRIATLIPIRLPSEKQCQLIWGIRTRLLDSGLPST